MPMNPLLSPIWLGDLAIDESILPLRNVDGTLSPIPLLYHAGEIISVKNAELDTEYVSGRDYILENGRIVIPEGSHISVMAHDDYYLDHDEPGFCFEHSENGWIRFLEGAGFHRKQTVVTYRHSDAWDFPVPENQQHLLPHFSRLMIENKPARILIFGDSISTGLNSSGNVDAAPYMPTWFDFMHESIKETCHNDHIALINTSIIGKTSQWGRETAYENATLQHPDLCVIGFGMNDGSTRKPAEEFIENLNFIMEAVRTENPNCEFILIATTLANREVKGFYGMQEEYLSPMLALRAPGVAVADMTTMHRSLLSRKAFRDMTGNNVNHPNDYLARVYAQVLLRTLGIL